MSDLLIQVAQIDNFYKHPNADSLFIAEVNGWQCITASQYNVGDVVVYIPPDTCLNDELAEKFGVANYLGKNGRIRAIKLRGEPSYGLIVSPDDLSWVPGQDVTSFYPGATKYEPPMHGGKAFSTKDAKPDAPGFFKYTDIENLRHYPSIIQDGDEVCVGEKCHGSNSRVGYVRGILMAGSHRLQREAPEEGETSLWWLPTDIKEVKSLLDDFNAQGHDIEVFGELVGSPIQPFDYGYKNRIGYFMFDIMVDGKYLDFYDFRRLTDQYNIPTVPILYVGPYSLEKVKELSGGRTAVPGGNHMKEGVVVRPTTEAWHPKVGRVIFKYHSDQYLLKKAQKEELDTTDV